MDFGRGRLIIRNDYRNTSNAFDGLHWQLGRQESWRFRLFLVEPVLRDVVQPDEQSKRSVFWGTSVESEYMPRLRLNAYYFGLNDQRSASVERHRTFSTFGTRLYDVPKTGRIDYEIESVWQTGKKGNIDHFAHFQHIDIGYTLDLPWSPRFLIHYDYASGTVARRTAGVQHLIRCSALDVSIICLPAISGPFFGRTSARRVGGDYGSVPGL